MAHLFQSRISRIDFFVSLFATLGTHKVRELQEAQGKMNQANVRTKIRRLERTYAPRHARSIGLKYVDWLTRTCTHARTQVRKEDLSCADGWCGLSRENILCKIYA